MLTIEGEESSIQVHCHGESHHLCRLKEQSLYKKPLDAHVEQESDATSSIYIAIVVLLGAAVVFVLCETATKCIQKYKRKALSQFCLGNTFISNHDGAG